MPVEDPTPYVDRMAALEAKYAATTCRFNILSLLPELRLVIYSYAMTSDPWERLSNLKLPALAMVSKQVRAEALPVFFATCHFWMYTVSNYIDAAILHDMAARNELPTAGEFETVTIPCVNHLLACAASFAGRDMMESDTRSMLARLREREHIVPAFRSIDLAVYAYYKPALVAFNTYRGQEPYGTIAIRVPMGARPRPDIRFVDENSVSSMDDVKELKALCEKARAKAEEIAAAREAFVGFAVEDLQEVVKAFKVWPFAE